MAFDQAIADQICEELANNSTSLREILKREGMPSSRQFYDWLEDVPKFAQQYARARERQGDTDADEVARVRRDVEDKKLTPEQGRVAIDALKWSAGKRSSKYNEKFVHQVDANVRLHVVDATLPK